MSNVAWVIVGALAFVVVLNMRRVSNVQTQQSITPNTAGGAQSDSPADTFESIAKGIAALIDSGANIAATAQRNGSSAA